MKKFVLFIALTISFFSYTAFCQLANHVVIAEIYAGGGNGTGAPYTNDYITLYNPTGSSVDVSTWSLQYSWRVSPAAPVWAKVNLAGSIPSGAYYLIQLRSGGTVTNDLPYYPDATDLTVALKKSVGKVALVNHQTTFIIDPTLPDASIIDFVGYGVTADLWEGTGSCMIAMGDRKGIRRITNSNTTNYNYGSDGSGWDSNDNSTDFYSQNELGLISNQPYATSPLANHVVIAEVFGGGGPSGTYRYDYVVLYNPSAATYDLSTWSLQYYNGATWDVENLSGIISPNAYYLIQLYDGGSGTALPVTPDVIGSINIDVTNGEVALKRDQVQIADGLANPLYTGIYRTIVDFIGYGSVSGYEGTVGPSSSPGLTSSIRRMDNSGSSTYGTNGSGWDLNYNDVNFYSQGSPIPLPVELTSFSASIIKNGVKLNWETETEVNNYGFEIHRSAQNDNWEEIGFVEGHGNSNSPKKYSFIDNGIVTGNYFYRLKQIDNDGTYDYSKVIEINFGTSQVYALNQNYPNPFNPVTSISFQIPTKSSVTLKVYDIVGKEVATLVDEVKEAGSYIMSFNGSGLASGFYIFKLQANDFVEIRKMVLMK
jgi:hypothetical protein